jgi:RNA polymerase sigma-70 factor (ECF subfamily)
MNEIVPVSESELSRRICAGDALAFETAFRLHYARLCDFANTIVRAPDIAEEVVQDVFANLWRNRSRLSINSTLRAYLYAAVRNRALNHQRRAAPELALDAQPERPAAEPGPHAALESAELRARVRAAIQSLPPRNREVLELRWMHGLTHKEIAESLGISLKGVENHLARGLAALRDRLGPLVP